MDNLINIDNGGTLTDICVVTKDGIAFTKTHDDPYRSVRMLLQGHYKGIR
ncbi:hypothetical protein CAURIC_08605 [Corynebacterium auriscanis]|nr:hypothetical protein CAURIC_08605 [Corynebacterium auriscanis]